MSDEKGKLASLSGAPIYRHEKQAEWKAPAAEGNIEEISAHIERHLGKIETVFHELLSDAVHVDVHFVDATEEFPFKRLVTSGMSDLPMTVPEGSDAPRYMELMATVPGDWRLEQAAFEDEQWYWPVRMLKNLARLPHWFHTWLGFGHTVPNGEPARPYAPNTKMDGALILPPVSTPEEFLTLVVSPEKTIHFMSAVPLYPEEMELKLRKGLDPLLEKFGAADVSDIIDIGRRNVARKRFGLF